MFIQMLIILQNKTFKAWWLFAASYTPGTLRFQFEVAGGVELTFLYNAATASLQGHRR